MVDVKQELLEHRTALLPLSPQVNFEFSAQGKSRNLCGTGLCGWNLLLWRSYFKVGGLLRRVPNQISQRTIRIIPWVIASVRTVWKRRLPVLRSKRTGQLEFVMACPFVSDWITARLFKWNAFDSLFRGMFDHAVTWCNMGILISCSVKYCLLILQRSTTSLCSTLVVARMRR